MKEATGELDMTVVVVMLVGMLASFFYFVIWPKIGQSQSTDCAKAVCKNNVDKDGYVQCTLTDKKTGVSKNISCKYKG